MEMKTAHQNNHVHIIGGGQLGQMLALAAFPLGITCSFMDPSPHAPARLVGNHECLTFEQEHIERFCAGARYITFEFENIPYQELETFRKDSRLRPPAKALEISQDRASEKRLFRELKIPTNSSECVDSWDALTAAVAELGLPAVIKTRRLGYDGKGQARISTLDNLDQEAILSLLESGAILEEFVPFDYELSCIGVFSKDCESRFYPVIQNVHRSGILYSSTPTLDHPMQETAQKYLGEIARALNYEGVLTVEFFVKDETLIANEIAPRVHNSGHWTIEGAQCSQFENHIRAVLGLPLGDTSLRCPHVKMWNIIGTEPPLHELLEVPGAQLHLYHKSPRKNRKIGHITLTADCPQELKDSGQRVEQILAA
jgi:5-(carboxyamino)imidazole ribonucleotide synthase